MFKAVVRIIDDETGDVLMDNWLVKPKMEGAQCDGVSLIEIAEFEFRFEREGGSR